MEQPARSRHGIGPSAPEQADIAVPDGINGHSHAWRCCIGENVSSGVPDENQGLWDRLSRAFFACLRNRAL